MRLSCMHHINDSLADRKQCTMPEYSIAFVLCRQETLTSEQRYFVDEFGEDCLAFVTYQYEYDAPGPTRSREP